MPGDVLALDTNAAIHLLNAAASPAWAARYRTIALPAPVVGELLFGALNSEHAGENLSRVRRLVAASQFLSADLDTTDAYARIRLELKKKGRPIPENDVWIAALCVKQNIPMATADEHFNWVDGLIIVGPEQW